MNYEVEQDEEELEDSGLGSDVHASHAILPMTSQTFTERESYGGIANFDPETYYRAYER